MVTGKGVPDLATRQLVYRLSTQFILPVVILTDCDPYGFVIALTYMFGSLAMAWAPERLVVPSAIWLGLLPSDLGELDQVRKKDIYQKGADYQVAGWC